MKNYQTYKAFPTPVFHFSLENQKGFNEELKKFILELKNQTKEVGIHLTSILKMISLS